MAQHAEAGDFVRQPPQDKEAERAVLGAIMLSKDAMTDVLDVLETRDFYVPAHETIFTVACSLYQRGDPIDPVSVVAELTATGSLRRIGGAEYVHELIADVPSVASGGYYARIVKSKAVLRRLLEACTRGANMALTAEGDANEIVDSVQEEVYGVEKSRDRLTYMRLSEVMETTIADIDAASHSSSSLQGIPTGFRDLDALLGGLRPGNLVVIAGRPAMGKSTLALDFLRSAAIHTHVPSVLFTLEMSRIDVTKRLLSAESGVKFSVLDHGHPAPTDWEKMATSAARVSPAPLFIDDSSTATLMDIRAKCRRLQQREGLGLVVVDYLQLMTSGRRVENRQQEVSEFSRSLKVLAKELDVPVVAVSSLNRASEARGDRRPMMSDLRDSGSIEQDADVVILVHRDDAYDRDNRPGECDLMVVKHRAGPTDTIAVAFKKDYAHFVDMAPDL